MPLDPLLQRLIKLTYRSEFAKLHTLPLDKVRDYLKTLHAAPEEGFYTDYILENDCQLRIFRPNNHEPSSPLPLVYYGRGCGGIAPEPQEMKGYCALLSKRLNAYVATLSFRLAPEYKFPIGLYDGLMGIKWIYNNYKQLNVEINNIVAWGESSGASAITVCCQLLKQEQLNIIQHQTLLYPMVDMKNDYPSKSEFGQGYLLDLSFLTWLSEQYLNNQEEKSDFRVSPLLNPDLSGLPPATIITAEYDPMRDEGEEYAASLKKAGNIVKHRRFTGVTHGFVVYHTRLSQAKSALDYACDELINFFKERSANYAQNKNSGNY